MSAVASDPLPPLRLPPTPPPRPLLRPHKRLLLVSPHPLVSNTMLATCVCLSDMQCMFVRNAVVMCRIESFVLSVVPVHSQFCQGSSELQVMNSGTAHWLHLVECLVCLKPESGQMLWLAFSTICAASYTADETLIINETLKRSSGNSRNTVSSVYGRCVASLSFCHTQMPAVRVACRVGTGSHAKLRGIWN